MPASNPPPIDPGSLGPVERSRALGGLAHPVPAGMRDLLPVEARRQQHLTQAILGRFARFGYEPVSVPPFEYADVLEHDMGSADSGQVLRFVEPETGEVVALRPDMTPQIARLIATRLGAAPLPIRLCYEGSVVRRRRERARRDRQLQQAGIELVGLGGPEGDLEVLSVACEAVRGAGLDRFTLDIGHAMVAGSLLAGLSAAGQREVVDALANKDGDEVAHRARALGVSGRELAALTELSSLYGGVEIFSRARPLLAGTAAEAPARELEELASAVREAELAPNLVVDFGETWSFSYYTGAMFRLLADGPGEPVGSGGRYDRLFDRFSMSRPAAGFAVDVGNLGWAIERSGGAIPAAVRVLVVGRGAGAPILDVVRALRDQGIACAFGPGSDARDYALAWRYSHVLEMSETEAMLISSNTGAKRELGAGAPDTIAKATLAALEAAWEKT